MVTAVQPVTDTWCLGGTLPVTAQHHIPSLSASTPSHDWSVPPN